ncbi:alpha/beta hydrolase [Clostridium uliginosum]|uniref:Acetyl esterase/lipase n=1 Tax=Clostridium uliginosum TaxID=119641 RepID=A0A1I1M262_9CLOT|nr:alpha/beta hydrolase [Clostridium uliginosum]SFC76703.1 Acetyl esterase/lipase [Clostridium uliginosum]
MKKFLKRMILLILVVTTISGLVFRKKISLCYIIAKDVISFKNNIHSYDDLNFDATEDMDYKNLVYKNTNGTELSLDIYTPLKKVYKTSPVLLYVHGGSWVYGDKSIPQAITPILNIFRQNGFTIISTSYELMREKENFEKQICDVKDSIRWINKNQTQYNLNADEIGVIGTSSGAHLSLMSAYTSNDEFQDDPELAKYSSKVKYVVDFFGPTDLSLLDTSNLNWDLKKIFKSAQYNKDISYKYNPINYVNSDIPKTLIIHSKTDSVVPYESSLRLYNKCIEVTGSAKLVSLDNAVHDLSEISSNDVINLSEEVLKFIIKNSPLF